MKDSMFIMCILSGQASAPMNLSIIKSLLINIIGYFPVILFNLYISRVTWSIK